MLKLFTAKGEQNQCLCLSWPFLPTGPQPPSETSHRKNAAYNTTGYIIVQIYATFFFSFFFEKPKLKSQIR